MDNPWAWTKAPANIMAIEAPVGVGYSYCASQKESNKPCINTDSFTASASRAALVDFFTNKFPEFQNNDFFITGESYAGVYIPTLSKEIFDRASGLVPLRGVAVGDPCTSNAAQQNSMDSLWYVVNVVGWINKPKLATRLLSGILLTHLFRTFLTSRHTLFQVRAQERPGR